MKGDLFHASCHRRRFVCRLAVGGRCVSCSGRTYSPLAGYRIDFNSGTFRPRPQHGLSTKSGPDVRRRAGHRWSTSEAEVRCNCFCPLHISKPGGTTSILSAPGYRAILAIGFSHESRDIGSQPRRETTAGHRHGPRHAREI